MHLTFLILLVIFWHFLLTLFEIDIKNSFYKALLPIFVTVFGNIGFIWM